MGDAEPGCSRPKRQKLTPRDPNSLTDAELEYYLLHSDSEMELETEDEYVPDTDTSGSESASESENKEKDGADLTIAEPTDPAVDVLPSISTTWNDQPDLKQFEFSKVRELKIQMPENNDPIEYFFMIADESFFKLVMNETNSYAEELFLTGVEQHSRITRWKPTTVEELKTFMGLLMHMGTLRTNRMQDYWKTEPLFNLKCFREHMSRDRFLAILRCLHFAQNVTGPAATEDRIYKIRPLLNFFNNKMHSIYQPGQNDESMVLWRGRLLFKQFIKNKRHKYGIKLYILTEFDGTILNMSVYTGALDSLGGKGHSKKVVLHLMQNYLGFGHSLYIDNFYTAIDLAEELLQNNTHCTGTINPKRRQLPIDVKQAVLQKGEATGQYRNGVLVGKWKDKREVLYLSTEFENNLTETQNKRNKKIIKPLPILKYNNFMSGVDRKDQMLSYYPVERKTLRWYKKLGIHIFHAMLLNSYYLFTKFSGQRMSLYDFRLQVIRKLLNTTNTSSLPRKPASEQHCAIKITTKNKKGETLRKKCRICSTKKIRKDTIYECAACVDKPGLCLGTCFILYHNK